MRFLYGLIAYLIWGTLYRYSKGVADIPEWAQWLSLAIIVAGANGHMVDCSRGKDKRFHCAPCNDEEVWKHRREARKNISCRNVEQT